MYHGDIRLGDTIDVKFTTRQITGAPFTLAGSPVISAYVGNGTTEITAGITLTVDFDSRTGLNNVRVVATSGNGFATATNIQLVITTGTVNSVSVVGEVIATFSIECRSALMPTTVARTLVVDASGLADANAVKVGPTGSGTAQTARDIGASVLLSNGTGTGQLKLASGYVAMTWADVAAPTTTVDLSGTTIKTTQKVDVDTIKTQALTAAAGITFPSSIASPTNITAGTITTATNVTTVNGLAANVITATSINADAITAAKIADGAIDAATFAAGAINAAAIAADAITDAKVASDVTIASVTGAVGSVTGAVGSVTGAVGSVTGTVGSVTGAVGSVTGNVGGNVTGSVGSVATGGIAAASFAAGAIDNAAIAANALGASELATDAVTEIANGILDLADGIETGISLRKAHRAELAAAAGKLSGAATTTVVIRDATDAKDRITATVDANGNRSAVTLDLT